MVGAETRRSEVAEWRLEKSETAYAWQFLILAAKCESGAAWLLKGIRVYHAENLMLQLRVKEMFMCWRWFIGSSSWRRLMRETDNFQYIQILEKLRSGGSRDRSRGHLFAFTGNQSKIWL